MKKLIADILVDIIGENKLRPPKIKGRKGFFAQKPFLPFKNSFSDTKTLVNREWVENKVSGGELFIQVPGDSIITPMAKLYADEKGVKIERC